MAIVLVAVACGGGSKPATRVSSSSASPAAGHLALTPAAPRTSSRVTFAFIPPVSSGRHGSSLLSFVLTIAGPRHPGCIGPRTAAVPGAIKGRTARVRLGGDWCPGAFTAQVQEFARAYCKPGEMCPQYVRLVATVARARFRVTAG